MTTPTSHHSVFLQAVCPSCHPTNSIKALKAILNSQKEPQLNTEEDFQHVYLTLDLIRITCSGNTMGDTAFPHWLVNSSQVWKSNLSIICQCHLNVLQILCQHVTPELPGSFRSSFAIFWEPWQCLTWYSSVVHSVYMSQPLQPSLPEDDFHCFQSSSLSYLLVVDLISPCDFH